MKKLFFILIIVALLYGCVSPQPQITNQSGDGNTIKEDQKDEEKDDKDAEKEEEKEPELEEEETAEDITEDLTDLLDELEEL